MPGMHHAVLVRARGIIIQVDTFNEAARFTSVKLPEDIAIRIEYRSSICMC
jgi:hypothetical protein